jgi:hypothetical protein
MLALGLSNALNTRCVVDSLRALRLHRWWRTVSSAQTPARSGPSRKACLTRKFDVILRSISQSIQGQRPGFGCRMICRCRSGNGGNDRALAILGRRCPAGTGAAAAALGDAFRHTDAPLRPQHGRRPAAGTARSHSAFAARASEPCSCCYPLDIRGSARGSSRTLPVALRLSLTPWRPHCACAGRLGARVI